MDIVLPRPFSASSAVLQAGEARELALREPVDEILRKTAALASCALPPSAKDAVAGITSAARQLGDILSSEDLPQEAGAEAREETFNLQRVLRKAHDSVASIAECSGTALSWYMPPHLGLYYRGNAARLENTLRLLLESSVRSASHGAIKLTARQLPGSADAGHLLFTVSDDGGGYPPQDRSSLALARAWELTGEYGGYLSVEASQEGTTIAFTAHFPPADAADAENEKDHLAMILSEDAEERRKLARIIAATPCNTTEVANESEMIANQNQQPAPLVVMQGKFARPAAGDIVREFCKLGRNKGIRKCFALAITPDESQWQLLKASGFTHALLEPVDPEVLRRTVATLLDIPQPPTELFRPDGTSLQEEPPANPDVAPKMLIEQGFAQKDIFEGPHWLVEDTQEDTPEAPAKAPEQKEKPDERDEHAGREEQVEQEPEEPAGIGDEPIAWPEQPGGKFAAPADAVEWVGEPTPVQKETQSQFDVQNFMQGSATLVQSALSGMLQEQQPAREQGHADPAVVEMLDLLEDKMRAANAAWLDHNSQGVAAAIGELAGTSEQLGLRVVTRMARCVEKAAQENAMDALKDILPELGNAVERTRILIMEKQGKNS